MAGSRLDPARHPPARPPNPPAHPGRSDGQQGRPHAGAALKLVHRLLAPWLGRLRSKEPRRVARVAACRCVLCNAALQAIQPPCAVAGAFVQGELFIARAPPSSRTRLAACTSPLPHKRSAQSQPAPHLAVDSNEVCALGAQRGLQPIQHLLVVPKHQHLVRNTFGKEGRKGGTEGCAAGRRGALVVPRHQHPSGRRSHQEGEVGCRHVMQQIPAAAAVAAAAAAAVAAAPAVAAAAAPAVAAAAAAAPAVAAAQAAASAPAPCSSSARRCCVAGLSLAGPVRR